VKPTVHVVPHTHWDREWYRTAARSQVRLAALVADVLEGLESGRLPAFLLDGQGLLLDEALAVRPDLAPRLRRQLSAGRLEAGPWYVLADNLLVSAEALVRNLFEGARAVRRHGGRPLGVGYAPDAFGHPAVLPSVLAGFGIGTALTWRGFGGDRGAAGDLFTWRGPDGASVLMIHLPPAGYEFGANLPVTPREAARRWKAIRAVLGPRARSPYWLLLNGADHHAPQSRLRDAVRTLEALVPDCRFRIGGLGEYARAVRRWARPQAGVPLLDGELREGRSHAWALQGTHGTRLHLKQANAQAQYRLERVAEPLAALAARGRALDLRAELWHAWRTLLANHAHDSLCGTGTDAVHREMMTRFARADEAALAIAERALDAVIGRDADAARETDRARWRPHLLVCNPAPRAGACLVEAEVALFVAEHPVGPASAGRRPGRRRPGTLVLRDAAGRELAYQELARKAGTDLVESPRHYPSAVDVEWRRVLVQVEDLPALGVAALEVGERDAGGKKAGNVGSAARRGRPASRSSASMLPVAVSGSTLVNEHLVVRVESDGTLAVADRRTGASLHGLAALVDDTDVGDSYTAAPRGLVFGAPDDVAMRLVHEGPLRAALDVVRRWDATGDEMTMRVSLDAGGRLVRLRLRGENRRGDHRLRIAFPSGVRAPRVMAAGPFGTVERPAGVPRPRARDRERPVPTAPMQGWVAAARGPHGLLVAADGLPQYEVRSDGTVLITVLRATGAVSRGDLPERPGHAAWPAAGEEGQCLGPFTADLAFALTDERGLAAPDHLGAVADELLVRPWAVMQRALLGTPAPATGPELEGEGLVFSALKPAESGRGIVLRCFNARTSPVNGAWRLPWPVRSAELCRLDETRLGALKVARGRVRFTAGPRAIVSVRVR